MSSQRIIDTGEGLIESFVCPTCKGQGYHHGFGENGCDPDWCGRCGGDGADWRDLLTPPET